MGVPYRPPCQELRTFEQQNSPCKACKADRPEFAKFVSIRKEAILPIHILFRTRFILCCQCFTVKKIQELRYMCKKSAKRDKAKNPRDTVTWLAANKLRLLAKLSLIVKSELKTVKKSWQQGAHVLSSPVYKAKDWNKGMVEVMKCLPRSEGCNVSFNTELYNSQQQWVVGWFSSRCLEQYKGSEGL